MFEHANQSSQDGRPGRLAVLGGWVRGWVSSTGMRQGVVLIVATTLAYGLDYLFNLAAGRLLEPADFGIVVALAGASQVMVVASRVIQTVVTRYIAGFQVTSNSAAPAAAFFRAAFGRAWILGAGVMVVLALAGRRLADFWQIPTAGPVLALAAAALLMAVRPVVGGVLQGEQRFAALGWLQVIQAALRLGLGIVLIKAGMRALGAMIALPIASALALLVGLVSLGKTAWQQVDGSIDLSPGDVSRYSAFTALGLIGYALLVNMDAILIKRFFDPTEAGYYGAAITLAKVIQFVPIAVIQILFSKAARRRAAHQDPRKALTPVVLLVLTVCGGLALLYALFPSRIVGVVFGGDYQLDGRVLGLLGAAMALYSLVNVWLNFSLSVEQMGYAVLIWLGVILQLVLMLAFHGLLWQVPAAMAVTALGLAVVGGVATLNRRSAP